MADQQGRDAELSRVSLFLPLALSLLIALAVVELSSLTAGQATVFGVVTASAKFWCPALILLGRSISVRKRLNAAGSGEGANSGFAQAMAMLLLAVGISIDFWIARLRDEETRTRRIVDAILERFSKWNLDTPGREPLPGREFWEAWLIRCVADIPMAKAFPMPDREFWEAWLIRCVADIPMAKAFPSEKGLSTSSLAAELLSRRRRQAGRGQ